MVAWLPFGEVVFAVGELPAAGVHGVGEEGFFVEGGVAGAGGDAAGVEVGEEFVAEAGARGAEHVEVVGVACAEGAGFVGREAGDAGEDGVEALGVFGAALGLGVEAGHLGREEGGLELGEAEVGAGDFVVELGTGLGAAAGVVVEGEGAFGKGGVGGEKGAAFAGVEIFGGLEGEAAEGAEGADVFGIPLGEVGLGGVFDEGELVFFGEGEDLAEFADAAGHVDHDDGAGARGDLLFDGGGVDLEGLGIDVGKDGDGMEAEDGVDGGDEGIGRDDDFVAGAEVEDTEGGKEGGGAVGDGEAMGGAGEAGVGLFKGGDGSATAAAPFAGVEDAVEGAAFGVVPEGPGGEFFVVGSDGGGSGEGGEGAAGDGGAHEDIRSQVGGGAVPQ